MTARLRTRRTLTLAGARRYSAHAAALAAFLAMTTGGEIPAAVTVAFGVGLALSLLKGDRQLPGLGAALTVATAGIGVVLLLLVSRGPLDLVLGAALFGAAVCLNRLLARRSPADDPLLLLTTLLLLAGGAALSGEATYGMCFALYGFMVTLALTFSHLERSADAAGLSGAARDALLSGALLRAVTGLAAVALVGAALFFGLFPRLNAQWLGRRHGTAHSPQIGFSGQVDLSGAGALLGDPRPALRVRFPDVDPASPPPGLYDADGRLAVLWRGVALDDFDGQHWLARPQRHHRRLAGAPTRGYGLRARVEVLPSTGGSVVFSPGIPEAARLTSHRETDAARPAAIIQAGNGDAYVQPAPRGLYSYEVWTRASANPARGRGRDYPRAVRDADLALPPGVDPRIQALAQRWAGAAQDPVDQALALTIHLRRDYRYTTALAGPQADPLAHFLFESKAGHCELFSTALAVMLRTLGVPAREVTGFAGGEPSVDGSYDIVRAGDAHSWVEVYVPGDGFVAFDPSPPAERGMRAHGLMAWLGDVTDAASELWRRTVLDYDLGTQLQLARRAGRALSELGGQAPRSADDKGLPPTWLWPALAACAAALVLIRLARKGRLGWAQRPNDEALRAYQAFVRALARRGVQRASSETPRELLVRVRAALPALATPASQLTALCEQARYAGVSWSPDQRRQVKALLTRIRRPRAA